MSALLGGCWVGGEDAPDALRSNAPDVVGFSVYPNRPFSYGEAILYNLTRDPVKLQSLRMVDASPGLRLVRAYALGPNRTFNGRPFISSGGQHTWPKHPGRRIKPLRPLRGHAVPSYHTKKGRRGVELWLKLRAPKRGFYRVRHFEVTYELDGATGSFVFAHTLLACARRDITKSCTPGMFREGSP